MTASKALLLACVSALCACSPLRTSRDKASPSQPFGVMQEKNFNELFSFAKSKSVDLDSLMRKAYEGDSPALIEAFEFGSTFRALDPNARAYANLIYSAFMNMKQDTFTRALLAASPAARQRTRDILHYPLRRIKESERADADADARKEFPQIFPADYRFGTNDGLFP